MRVNSDLVNSMRQKGYVTSAEAARMTKRHVNTIRYWCSHRGLEHVRDGALYFIHKESLLKVSGEPITQEESCA